MSIAQSAMLPLPAAECRITVCIPARNEESLIEATLAALIAQRGLDGRPLARGFFDVIVFPNNCSDDSAAIVRAVAARTPHLRIFTVEGRFPRADAHIGSARKQVLDLAVARFLAAGRPHGIVASIDSDTLAGDGWIASIAREMRGRDAVAGQVTIGELDQERLLAPVRLLYARELAYRRALAEIEAVIDPRPEDPQPRHGSFVGASFAVTAHAYTAAGGLPPLQRLEDLAFARALRRVDARIRYSTTVRATTSARLCARVDGGFGTFIGELYECARRGTSFTVEHPQRSIEDLESRAALRRVWDGEELLDDVERISAIFNLTPERWLPRVDRTSAFGAVYERLARDAENRRRIHAPVLVEAAIDELRTALASARHAATLSDDTASEYAG
jgi:hypothetical protein